MVATVDLDNIFRVGLPAQSLAQYLSANPPDASDVWQVVYDDTTPGNDQARYVSFGFEVFDPGDPGIVVNGDAALADQIYGTSGKDSLSSNGGNDIIDGRGGDDFLSGGSGDDILFGGLGADRLLGGVGADTLTGGAGSDVFKWQAGDLAGAAPDFIADFESGPAGDILDLSELLAGWAVDKGSHVKIVYSAGGEHLLSDGVAQPAVEGDVTVQVELPGGTWTNVATIDDTGSNLTSGNDIVRFILDGSTIITDEI